MIVGLSLKVQSCNQCFATIIISHRDNITKPGEEPAQLQLDQASKASSVSSENVVATILQDLSLLDIHTFVPTGPQNLQKNHLFPLLHKLLFSFVIQRFHMICNEFKFK